MFDNVAGERNGVVETESLGGFSGGFVTGFFDFVDLFFGVAAGFGEKNFGAFDKRGFDVSIAVARVSFGNFGFKTVESGLNFWQKFVGARNWGGIYFFHTFNYSTYVI